jgi:3-dehydroquinate synthase
LPVKVAAIPGAVPDAGQLMQLIAQDKKVKRGKLVFILSRGIGKAFVAGDVDANEIHAFFEEKLSR